MPVISATWEAEARESMSTGPHVSEIEVLREGRRVTGKKDLKKKYS